MNARWAQEYADASATLAASPWLAPMPKEAGVRVFEVMHDLLTGKAAHSHDTHDRALADVLPSADAPKRGKHKTGAHA